MLNLKINSGSPATSEEVQLASDIFKSQFEGMVESSFPEYTKEQVRQLGVIFTAGALAGVVMSANTNPKAAHLAVHNNINWLLMKGKVNA